MPRLHTQTRPDPDNAGKFIVEDIPFTKAEETARDAEEAEYIAGAPFHYWKNSMDKLDKVLTRTEEDLFDALNDSDKAKVSQSTKDKVASKKARRAQKPR